MKDLTADDTEIRPLITGFDASYDVVGTEGQTLYVQTNLDAPNRRVVAIDLDNPDRANWETIVPESDAVLQSADMVGGRLAVQRLTDVKGRLAIYSLDGSMETRVELPTIGSVGAVSGDPDRSTFYYGFTSFTHPTTVFKYDLESGTSTTISEPEVPGFDADRYAVKQVFYESTDGTEVPMFLVHKKGLEQEAVISRCSNSIQVLAGRVMSEYSAVAVISTSWLIIRSILGLTCFMRP